MIFPSGINNHVLLRRDIDEQAHLKMYRLVDPQIYLSSLPVDTCPKACVNLASYEWFPGKPLREYRSSRQKQREWAKQALKDIKTTWTGTLPSSTQEIQDLTRICIQTQMALGCNMLILPSPMVSESWMGYGAQAQWLDIGIRMAHAYPGVPFAATIALADGCLRSSEPANNRLLEQVADQVSARAPHAAHIVIEQGNEEGGYCTSGRTVGGLLHLVRLLKLGGVPKVLVAFAGTAGLLALAAGADTWTTGWYRKERRLRLKDFEDEDEGRTFPTYYSHTLAGEIGLEADLDFLVSKGLLPNLSDTTDASAGLLRALAEGNTVGSVPSWQHRLGNATAARWHLLAVCLRETAKVSSLENCADHFRSWLAGAEEMASRIGEFTQSHEFDRRTTLVHQSAWRKAFDEFLASN